MGAAANDAGLGLARPPAARVFFALWPEAALQRELGRRARAIERASGGRATRTENIHLTLVFLGDVAVARLPDLCAAAGGVTGEPCALALDRLGYWKHNRIAWAGTSAMPPPLAALVAGLEASLAAAGFAFDRRPYVPHITLVRQARAAEPARFDRLDWPCREFVLVQSARDAQGARYEIIGRWGLAGAGPSR